jgi:acetyl esterase/lipase
MTLDPQAKRLIDMLGAAGQGGDATLEQRRRGFAALMRWSGPPPAAAKVVDRAMPGPGGPIALRLYRPAAAADILPGLVFFHGGGLVAGGLDTHDAMCGTLAVEGGCAVIAVDYRRAPEHRFPAAIEDCAAATRWAAENAAALGLDVDRLGVAGDSAGGGLAAAVCQIARGGDPRLVLQLLLYPVLDPAGETASRRAFASGYFLDGATIRRDLADYCPPGTNLADPRLAPLRAADFSGLPPAIVHTAGYDPMRDEGEAYADLLAAAGVPVVRHQHAGMIHHFLGLGGVIAYARAAWRAIGADVREALA